MGGVNITRCTKSIESETTDGSWKTNALGSFHVTHSHGRKEKWCGIPASMAYDKPANKYTLTVPVKSTGPGGWDYIQITIAADAKVGDNGYYKWNGPNGE